MRNGTQILPRLIRLKDAPFYLGMDRNRFEGDIGFSSATDSESDDDTKELMNQLLSALENAK